MAEKAIQRRRFDSRPGISSRHKKGSNEMTLTCVTCGKDCVRRSPLQTHCKQCHRKSPATRNRQRKVYRKRLGIHYKTWKRIRSQILARDQLCQLCGALDNLTIDHIIPLSDGGGSEASNLRVLCETCHESITRQYHLAQAH